MPKRAPFLAAIVLAATAAIVPATALAASKTSTGIAVDNAWFATMAHDGPTFGYFRITNHGGDPRLITGFSAPACASLKLEEAHGGSTHSKAAVQMTVAGKTSLAFSRGGYHLVCERGDHPVPSPGQTIPVSIMLDGGATVAVTFAVRPFPH